MYGVFTMHLYYLASMLVSFFRYRGIFAGIGISCLLTSCTLPFGNNTAVPVSTFSGATASARISASGVVPSSASASLYTSGSMVLSGDTVST